MHHESSRKERPATACAGGREECGRCRPIDLDVTAPGAPEDACMCIAYIARLGWKQAWRAEVWGNALHKHRAIGITEHEAMFAMPYRRLAGVRGRLPAVLRGWMRAQHSPATTIPPTRQSRPRPCSHDRRACSGRGGGYVCRPPRWRTRHPPTGWASPPVAQPFPPPPSCPPEDSAGPWVCAASLLRPRCACRKRRRIPRQRCAPPLRSTQRSMTPTGPTGHTCACSPSPWPRRTRGQCPSSRSWLSRRKIQSWIPRHKPPSEGACRCTPTSS